MLQIVNYDLDERTGTLSPVDDVELMLPDTIGGLRCHRPDAPAVRLWPQSMRDGRNRFVLPAIKGHAVLEGRRADARRAVRSGRATAVAAGGGLRLTSGAARIGEVAAVRPATIRDVARLAGISKSAVARVLSGQGYASAELRGAVLAAAEALGYSPNAVGKSFRQQRTGTIGLIVPDITNPFYAFVADGVLEVAREQEYRVVLVASDEWDAAELRCLMLLMESRVDGILAVPAGGNAAAWSKAIRLGRKVVLVDREVPGIEGVPLVCVDNRGGVLRKRSATCCSWAIATSGC